jgi:hypothetical protein
VRYFRTFDLSLMLGGWYKQEERDPGEGTHPSCKMNTVRAPGLHPGDRRSGILEYLPGETGGKEEDAARWKQKPIVALYARAPTP